METNSLALIGKTTREKGTNTNIPSSPHFLIHGEGMKGDEGG